MERRAMGGLLARKERWGLSGSGWALVLLAVLGLGVAGEKGLYPFLAVTERAPGEVLVIEGWIRSQNIEQAAREYQAGHYRDVVVVTAPYGEGTAWDSRRFNYALEDLIARGVPKERLHGLLSDTVQKDRTYQSALTAKKWIETNVPGVKAIDVVTLGPHARRSRLLFQKAFGRETRVGVIALEETSYDPARWWRSSDGVRDVLFEGVAYVYARVFFS